MFFCQFTEAAISWDIGFYLSGSDCMKCSGTCLTWSDGSSCDSWTESMFLNATTNLWQFCTGNEYYDNTAQQCDPWNGKCTEKWAFQPDCFDCPAGKIFHLEELVWVDDCGMDAILITDPQLWNKPICRPLKYYIDESSRGFIELGTNKHPYKNLELVFVEILNFHSHSDCNITIYVKELTENVIGLNLNYILNITKVEVWSYSDSNPISPRNADIYFSKTISDICKL